MTVWTVSNALSPAEVDTAYRLISEEGYWAKGIPRDFFER